MKQTSRWIFGLLGLLAASAPGQEAQVFDRLTFYAAPKPLAADAKISDWPRVLGPSDDVHSPETHLLKEFPANGLAKVWEVGMGEGYNSPAISGDFCVIFHAMEKHETIECLNRETGRRYWTADYAIEYQDRYGFGNGPRASPVIAKDCVVTLGVTSELHAYDLKTGKELWKHDLRTEFNVPQDFFGHGSSPLILDGKVIVQVGGKKEKIDGFEGMRERKEKLATPGVSLAAFDLQTGKVLWTVEDEWGASYASPVPVHFHGKTKVVAYLGGESSPATGGLICVDPADGTVHDRFPWRDDEYIQATGSSPMVVPEKNRVFISTCYPKGHPQGGVMVEFDENFKAKEVWKSTKVACHWMTPLYRDGYLYAIDGEREDNSRLVCVNADTGGEVWSQNIEWEDAAFGVAQGRSKPVKLSILRAGLLEVDGSVLCLGETGSLHWLALTPEGVKVTQQTQLFYALSTWSLPAVSRGLLYVRQQAQGLDRVSGTRVICYDLRAGK